LIGANSDEKVKGRGIYLMDHQSRGKIQGDSEDL
jgi:hypothetical protein